jgi:hypothetical protein
MNKTRNELIARDNRTEPVMGYADYGKTQSNAQKRQCTTLQAAEKLLRW